MKVNILELIKKDTNKEHEIYKLLDSFQGEVSLYLINNVSLNKI